MVDAGYPNTWGFFRPYINRRYHLQDFRRGTGTRNKEELFNFYHSSLRNLIEHCFGVLKVRFLILKEMAPYPFSTQRYIVVTAMAMHNFICQEAIMDTLFNEYYDEREAGDDENVHKESHSMSFDDEPDGEDMLHNVQGQQKWEVRDAIADAIFIAHS